MAMAMGMSMSMSMSNVLLEPPWTFIAPKPTRQPPSRFKNSFSYTLPRTFIALKPTKLPPSPSFSTRHLSHRLSSKHAAVGSISLLLKEHKGFVVNRNSSAFWALSFWDDVKQTDKKSTCICAAKNNNNVTEKKDDKQAAKRTSIKTQRRSGGKRSRKIYAVIIGVSFCVVLAIFPLVQPKQGRALLAMIQRLPFMSMLSYFFAMLKFAVSWTRTYFWGYKLFLEHNRHRKSSKIQSVTFDDVAGVDGAKTELLEIVSCLGEDSKYIELGAKLPRGVLLSGPPGTGKTLLARAVAGEADVAFFTISASEFVERYVGVGAARVRAIFQAARKRSPSIIFIDEIDAVGGERGTSHNRERDQTLNQLLTEMDGFEKSEKVVVIAATNRPEMLDPALVRPGRFSRKVVVGEPDEDGRRNIFGLYIDALKMEDDKQVISDLVASRTPGLVGADLENIANEAAFLAARRDGEFVTKEDVLQAVERAIATRKICKNDNARKICKGDNASTEAKSPYLFGQKALESVPFQGRSKEFSIKMGRIPIPFANIGQFNFQLFK